jgi:DNA (cytosine-5)-methyltransferase 1
MTTMEPRTDGVSNTLTSVQKDNYLCIPEATKSCQHGVVTNYRIRKLTPRECFRLMGVDDADIDKIQLYPFGADIEYPAYSHKERLANMSEEEKRVLMRKGISNSQQYKLAGNSIVVDNLYHIFRTMFVDKPTKRVKQLTLF